MEYEIEELALVHGPKGEAAFVIQGLTADVHITSEGVVIVRSVTDNGVTLTPDDGPVFHLFARAIYNTKEQFILDEAYDQGLITSRSDYEEHHTRFKSEVM